MITLISTLFLLYSNLNVHHNYSKALNPIFAVVWGSLRQCYGITLISDPVIGLSLSLWCGGTNTSKLSLLVALISVSEALVNGKRMLSESLDFKGLQGFNIFFFFFLIYGGF